MRAQREWRSAVLILTLALVACSDRKDDDSAATAATTVSGPAASSGPATVVMSAATAPTTDLGIGDPQPGGRLVVSGESEAINPWTPARMQCDNYCMLRARTIFDPLAVLGARGVVHPYLAESITPNSAFTEWTVVVRPGISFADGTALDAAAVIANLQGTGTGNVLSASLNDVAKRPDGSLWIDQLDERTLVIRTGHGGDPDQPLSWPRFDVNFTGQWGLIASPTWLAAAADDPALEAHPVGSGPFLVDSFAPRQRLLLSRNPGYWRADADGRQLPYLDEVEFRVIDDGETAAAALRNGDLDAIVTADGAVIAGLRGELPMVEQGELGGTGYLLIDLEKPGPLADRRVRCALSQAIDRDELNQAVGGGIFAPANGLFSPGQEGYLADNGTSVERDIDGARQLLEEYTSATGEPVQIDLWVPTAQWSTQTAELITGQWREIGVDADWETTPQDALISNALFGVPEFTISLWRGHAGATVDEQNLWWNSAGARPDGELSLNLGRLRDEVVDANLAIARSSTNADVRRAAAEEINRRMAEQCYQIPLLWHLWGLPHQPNIHGIEQTVLPDGSELVIEQGLSGQFRLETVWRDQSG